MDSQTPNSKGECLLLFAVVFKLVCTVQPRSNLSLDYLFVYFLNYQPQFLINNFKHAMEDKMELDGVEINSESSEKTEELSDGEWAALEAAEKEAIEKFKDQDNNNSTSNSNKRHPASLEEDQKKMSLVFEEPAEEEDNFFQPIDNQVDSGVRTRQAISAQTNGKNFLFYSGKNNRYRSWLNKFQKLIQPLNYM